MESNIEISNKKSVKEASVDFVYFEICILPSPASRLRMGNNNSDN